MQVTRIYLLAIILILVAVVSSAQVGINSEYEQFSTDPGLDTIMGVDRSIQNDGQYWVDPKLISKIDPDYPVSEYNNPRNVTVILDLYIDEHGQINDTRVISSAGSAFDRAAVESVYRWLFEPGLYYGEPHKAVLSVGVAFYMSTIPGYSEPGGRTDTFPEGTEIPKFTLFE